MPTIEENLKTVSRRMQHACEQAGRDPGEVQLVAVTKTVGVEEIRELYRLGVRRFGENRVADGIAHRESLDRPDAAWHLIGHLQRNKAGTALAGGFTRIHSVESSRLVEVLNRECARLGLKAEILLEVNVSGEESKYGVDPKDVENLARLALEQPALHLVGLMTMAPFSDRPEDARPTFRGLADCRKRLCDRLGIALPHLSMGMTGDFEVAIEEGATLVRIGTALFS